MRVIRTLQNAVLASLCILPALSAQAATNLLTNASFEAPVIQTNYSYYNPGSTTIAGWTVVGGQIQLTSSPYSGLNASAGLQWIDMTGVTGYGKGLQSDAVATVLGQQYTLTFDLGNYVPFGTSTLSVRINNGPVSLFTNMVNGSGMDWESQSLTWVADATSAKITFLGAANGSLSNDLGIGLDNVGFSAMPVPEPETWAMLLSGLGLVGFAARRRT